MKAKEEMEIMVIGGGGREHAFVWKFLQDNPDAKIVCAPGNAGIRTQGANCIRVHSDGNEIENLAIIADFHKIGLTIVGPEIPLSLGIVDAFRERGLKIFGPTQEAARTETSKVFAKLLMRENNIPTANFRVFSNPDKAKRFIRRRKFPLVIKADGLAAGKGAIVCENFGMAVKAIQKIMVKKDFGEAGNKIVIENYLPGEEVSFLAFTDGETILPMITSQDHKRIYDNDKGDNTGGMGAYAPAPIVTPEIHQKIMNRIMIPAVQAMKKKGISYQGVLYAGLKIVDNEPFVLEFNCRFGDPETQPMLMLMKNDLLKIIEATLAGKLHQVKLDWHNGAAVCVVAASAGYPGPYKKGRRIKGLDSALDGYPNAMISHAGTVIKNGGVFTNGGRVLGVTARGENLAEAKNSAYKILKRIRFKGIYYRMDIGDKGIIRFKKGAA